MSDIALEEDEQGAFVTWFEMQYPNVLMFHIPNGAGVGIKLGKRLKKMGLKSGIPDLMVPAWKLWIEMKRVKGGKLSDNQQRIIGHLRSVGYRVIVAQGCMDAIEQTRRFLSEQNSN